MKSQIKAVLRAVAPKTFDALMAARINRYGQQVMAKHGVPEITSAFVARYGLTVLGGPFAGMHYINESAGSSFLPKLIGSYECELYGVIKQILATKYDTVVDVGSAEGFYVVGLAMRMQFAPKIVAFDINRDAQELCRSLAKKNNVEDKIIVSGFCDTAVLQTTLQGRSLVVCDCEGYETELLQPSAVPALARADILVELHDCLKPGITQVITDRFSHSHHILMIDSVDRDPDDYPVINFLSAEQQRVAVSEFRNGPQQWAFMAPKHGEVAG
jgi:hypothetical protein